MLCSRRNLKMAAIIYVACLLTLIIYLTYLLAHRKFNYWKKKSVPYVKPLPFLGNYAKYILLQEYVGHLVQKLCKKFPDAPYFGAFFGTEPVLVVQSPEVLKYIFTKDFYYFHGREISKYVSKEVVTENMFFTGGNKWKLVRQNLTPLFTSSKMKNMFYLVEKCCHVLEDTLDREINISNIIAVRHLSARYTMDCICSCAFGINSNTLTDAVNNSFNIIAEEIFKSTNYRGFKMIFRAVWPGIFYGLGFKCFPDTIELFFSKLLKGVFESRNYKPSARNDFVDLVLSLKNENVITCDNITNAKTGLNEKISVKVDDNLLVSQCILFFGAGFETSSTILSFTLYEFAKSQEVQKRAAEEVDKYLRCNGSKLNYECVKELPYVEACMYETIRKYPVLGNLTREVMDDYTLPDGLLLNKGVRIHVPVYHIHHNPNNFPDPEVYKPERFLPEQKEKTEPYTFFPFGEGPRVCIGKQYYKKYYVYGSLQKNALRTNEK